MKLRYGIALTIAAFMICLLTSAFIVQSRTGILFETRGSALATTLEESRFETGSRPPYFNVQGESEDRLSTAWVLSTLMMLGELGKVDVEKGLSLILSEQSLTAGNVTLWGWPSRLVGTVDFTDPYATYTVTESLKLFGALNRVNRTALIDVVTSMYNESDGGFYQPTTKVNVGSGEEDYATIGFPLDFPGTDPDIAYANSNIISTFLAVSILADLNALNSINTTKTLNFILSCEAENGAFTPFPGAQQEFLPGWSSFIVNPFHVDAYGTGLPYTFAATGALKALGIHVESVVDSEKIASYVLSCQETYPPGAPSVRFLALPNDSDLPPFACSYFALKTLQYVDMVENETAVCSKAAAYILEWLQDVSYTDSWPLPVRQGTDYGLFPDLNILETAYFAINILNATNNLRLLDQPTPIVSATWTNLAELSILTSASTAAIVILSVSTHSRLKARKGRKEHTETSPSTNT
jgi:prenyltransferase beta subunit